MSNLTAGNIISMRGINSSKIEEVKTWVIRIITKEIPMVLLLFG